MDVSENTRSAAEAAADPSRTLPEENVATTRPTEVRRWVRTYGQLVGFKNRVLQAAYQQLGHLTEDAARHEAVSTDLVLLRAQDSRLRRRLKFWKRREEQLNG
jgi:hypothetical protein